MPDHFPVAVITADVVKVSVNRTKVHPQYLAAAINSPWGRQQVASITAGVTRAKITLRDFRTVRIRLPPLATQRQFVSFAAALEALKNRLGASSQESGQLFDALVHRAFNGELTATNGADKPPRGMLNVGGR
jgi:type I restriction enzyme S subunit